MSTSEIDRDAWLAERRKGLGGSDIAAALGLSRYKTPYTLYLEKIGEKGEDDLSKKVNIRWGNLLEPVVASRYEELTGTILNRVNKILVHPVHPFMLANIDRRVVGQKRGVEIKTTNHWIAGNDDEWGEPGTDQVPVEYLLQCLHYLAVTGYEQFDTAMFFSTTEDVRIYPIKRDEEAIADLIEREIAFWNHVETKTPPPLATVEDVKKKWPMHTAGKTIEATEAILSTVKILDAARKGRSVLEKEEEKAMDDLAAFVGENEAITYAGTPIFTYKAQSTGVRVNTTVLKSLHPKIADECSYEGFTRVGRVVQPKKEKGKKE